MRPLIALALVLMLAGCFGHGPDAAGRGDIVAFTVTAHEATTGALVVNEAPVPFDFRVTEEDAPGWRIGEGALGPEFDRHLLGAAPGDVIEFSTPAPKDLRLGSETTVRGRLADQPADGAMDLRAWPPTAGAPVPGEVAEAPTWAYPRQVLEIRINTTEATATRLNDTVVERHVTGQVVQRVWSDGNIVERTVPINYTETTRTGYQGLGVGNTTTDPPRQTGTVVFRHHIDGEHRRPALLSHGGIIISTFNETSGAIERRVEPVPGVVFAAGTPNDYQLTTGLYRVARAQGDEIVVQPVLTELTGLPIYRVQPLHWTVTIQGVQDAPPGAEPLEGHEGTRLSPVLGG